MLVLDFVSNGIALLIDHSTRLLALLKSFPFHRYIRMYISFHFDKPTVAAATLAFSSHDGGDTVFIRIYNHLCFVVFCFARFLLRTNTLRSVLPFHLKRPFTKIHFKAEEGVVKACSVETS